MLSSFLINTLLEALWIYYIIESQFCPWATVHTDIACKPQMESSKTEISLFLNLFILWKPPGFIMHLSAVNGDTGCISGTRFYTGHQVATQHSTDMLKNQTMKCINRTASAQQYLSNFRFHALSSQYFTAQNTCSWHKPCLPLSMIFKYESMSHSHKNWHLSDLAQFCQVTEKMYGKILYSLSRQRPLMSTTKYTHWPLY